MNPSCINVLQCFCFRVPTDMSTQAPTFTQPLQSVVALEGSAATFEAQVSGKKPLKRSHMDRLTGS